MFVVRSDDSQFHMFTFDSNTARPQSLPAGARVRVTSVQSDQADARLATEVVALSQAPTATSAGTVARKATPVPQSVNGTMTKIQQETRFWHIGARAGVALDPELVLFGVHSQMGPIFARNVFFRPNAEFAFGEITDMISLNLEVVYRARTMRSGEWSPYFGAGPALEFINQSFKTSSSQSSNISFSNFNYQTGFNILMGVENRHSTFFEVKASLWSSPGPVLRLIVGKNF